MQVIAVDVMVMNVINKKSKRILILGKVPPIEGGVSEETYYNAINLGNNGYEIHLVTNANEVEEGFRIHLTDEDRQAFNKMYNVFVHYTTKGGDSYIPRAKPYFSKLFGLAQEVMNKYRCELIYSHYFEPYCVVAAIISKLYNIPLIIRHAGSDLARLSTNPNLAMSYKFALNQASIVLTSSRTDVIDLLSNLELDLTKTRKLGGKRLPEHFLKPKKDLCFSSFSGTYTNWYLKTTFSENVKQGLDELNKNAFNKDALTIAVYGKIHESKGSYDLIAALNLLADQGLSFNFLTIAGGSAVELDKYYNSILHNVNLKKRTRIFPLIAPWHVSTFLALSDIVCFLERDFSVKIHNPRIPREILSSKKCLVCSREIYEKLSFKENLVDGKNFILINDPKNTEELRSKLEFLIKNSSATKVIGKHGGYVSHTIESNAPTSDILIETIEYLIK